MSDFDAFLSEVLAARRPELGNLVVLATVSSTNDLGRAVLARGLAETGTMRPLIVLAYEQTAGRGRAGRRWMSPPGQGIYASLVLPRSAPRGALASLPLVAGVGLARGLEPYLERPVGLKWPNDLVIGDRKLGGVLVEAVTRGAEPPSAVIGFGVNWCLAAAGRPPGAIAVRDVAARDTRLGELAWALLGGLAEALRHAGDLSYTLEAYRKRSVHRPGEHLACRTSEGRVEGSFAGFDDAGFLRLRVGGRILHLHASELEENEDR